MISPTSSRSLSKYSRKNQKGDKFFAERSKAGQRELFLSLIFLSCAVNPFLLCRMTMAMNQVQARIRYLEQFFAFFAPNVLPERSSEVGINDLGSPNLVNSSLLQTKVQLGWKSTFFFFCGKRRLCCVVKLSGLISCFIYCRTYPLHRHTRNSSTDTGSLFSFILQFFCC